MTITMFKNNRLYILLILMSVSLCHCAFIGRSPSAPVLKEPETALWQQCITAFGAQTKGNGLSITYPYDGAVFPPEMAAPVLKWQDREPSSTQWLVAFQFNTPRNPIYALVDKAQWSMDRKTWEAVKASSQDGEVDISIFGIEAQPRKKIISSDSIRIYISKDRVDATILYRQVPLPFSAEKAVLRQVKWRLGDIASYEPTPVVMQNQENCASCHTVTRDGSRISMEMNYGGDGGAQFIAPVRKTVELSAKHFMTWSDFPKPEILPPTRGTFAKLSPDGRYMVGTVNEISFFALTSDPAFCQLFFPTYGILAWYDVKSRRFHPLPGADNIHLVQTDPSWRWDNKQIVFARAAKKNEYHEDITRIRTLVTDADIRTLNRQYPIQFDLYQIPFNQGRGGVPQALKGASGNGMSNYFARYSPDGRWIVFTRSRSGIMLQPDSALYIIPAQGGSARRMQCNTDRFNSWHSFSPNGRWLLFSSKTNSDYTEIFLTHMDENGMDSPPVCLSRFSDSRYAANVPEFVNVPPGGIEKIVLAE